MTLSEIIYELEICGIEQGDIDTIVDICNKKGVSTALVDETLVKMGYDKIFDYFNDDDFDDEFDYDDDDDFEKNPPRRYFED